MLYLIIATGSCYILEHSSEIKAFKVLQEAVEKTGKAEIITSAAAKEIQGDKLVKTLVYEDTNTKEEKTLSVEGVFIEIGYVPETSFVKELVDLDEEGEILFNPETSQTKTPGLFAAGDVSKLPYKQIVISAGEGAKAALSAINYLKQLK